MNLLQRLLGKGARYLERLSDPEKLRRSFLYRSPHAPFSERLEWDALSRPQYGYGIYHSALQAKALGLPGVTAVEFGVAGGAGLVCLEEYAAEVEREVGVRVAVAGFDLGSGLPKPIGFQDLMYVWQPGFYQMDVPKLKGRLTRAELFLGDVRETVPQFLAASASTALPVGFIAFDLDYYSSTAVAFRLLEASPDRLLPRAYAYLDDIIGNDHLISCEFVGELLAVNEFNAAHLHRKIAPIYGFSHKRRIPAPWNDMMFVCHSFDHPLYNKHIYPEKNHQLPLGAG